MVAIIVSITREQFPAVFKALSAPSMGNLVISRTPYSVNIFEDKLQELTVTPKLREEIMRVITDTPQCDCCHRKVTDGVIVDYRDPGQEVGGRYLVCSSCRMLVDENFFMLYGLVGAGKTVKVVSLLKGAAAAINEERGVA